MPRITPIPTTRVSDSFAMQRQLTQLQNDQTELLKIQTQISTGKRILAPSEDAPAALRAISLQRLLEQKAQVKTNLQTNQSFLSATDVALSRVSNLLNETRGSAQAVSSTVATQQQRETAAQAVDRALVQLVDTGNQRFRDRSLFAGSKTGAQPFELVNGRVIYHGNEKELQSFSDIDILFETNIPGSRVFGALSEPVRGTADLNPTLSFDTALAAFDAGNGLKLGSLRISDGTNGVNVDLSSAHDFGDVKALLEANPPLGRTVTVDLTHNALTISLDSGGGGNLFIDEVGEGTIAADLGLLNNSALGTGPLTGRDLNPGLTSTTALDSLLGSYAKATANTVGANNALLIAAKQRGPALNGYTLNFIDSGAVTVGGETVAFDAGTNTFTVDLDSGNTTANDVLTALNNTAAFNVNFSAALGEDGAANDGTGFIDLTATGVTAGGTGTEFDQNSGLNISNDGQTYTLDFDAAETVEDLLNIINGSAANVVAAINAAGTGIDVRSRLSGVDFQIGENGGVTAAQLGLKTFQGTTKLADLNHGLGVHTNASGDDFQITRRDGTILTFNVDGLNTVDDVVNLINNHPGNQLPAARVTAQFDANGQGIELIDNSPGAGSLQVTKVAGSQAASDLGLIPIGQDNNYISGGGATVTLTGRDVNPQEVESIFTALIRLREALRGNDSVEIERSFTAIDNGNEQLSFVRAEIGARQQGLDVLQARLEDEEIELQSALSSEVDIDLAAAISNLTARQAALEASLKVMASLNNLTLLDFL